MIEPLTERLAPGDAVLGVFAASLALRGILGPVGSLGATLPGLATGGTFAVEWLLSFALMFVVMAVGLGLVDQPVGRGRAVLFMDNPVERAMWVGNYGLLLNAILFGAS